MSSGLVGISMLTNSSFVFRDQRKVIHHLYRFTERIWISVRTLTCRIQINYGTVQSVKNEFLPAHRDIAQRKLSYSLLFTKDRWYCWKKLHCSWLVLDTARDLHLVSLLQCIVRNSTGCDFQGYTGSLNGMQPSMYLTWWWSFLGENENWKDKLCMEIYYEWILELILHNKIGNLGLFWMISRFIEALNKYKHSKLTMLLFVVILFCMSQCIWLVCLWNELPN